MWLDAFDAGGDARGGLLCRRHADAMVVPLGWMLDDRREPVPRLFQTKVRSAPASRAPIRRRTRQRAGDDTVQLRLDAIALDQAIAAADAADDVTEVTAEAAMPDHVPEVAVAVADPPKVDDEPMAWMPHFDQSDDLAGLLKTRGTLLARAFNGTIPRHR